MTTSIAVRRRFSVVAALTLFALLLSGFLAPAALGHDEAAAAGSDAVGQAMLGQFDRTAGKLVQLANAIPEDHYGWRPADGVRSVSESLMHTAAANFSLAAALGVTMPDDMPEDMEAVTDKAAVVKALEDSIDSARRALENAGAGDMGEMTEAFGQKMPRATVAFIILSHNGEHLGQLIAYGRSNGVVPPWSQPQAAAADGSDDDSDTE